MDKNKIDTLKKIFTITSGSFTFAELVQTQLGAGLANSKFSLMRDLHRLALIEMESESPDENKINELLQQMEDLARSPIKQ